MNKESGIFSVRAPQYVMRPQLQSTCHYIVNHYVKIWHMRLGGANNMRSLSWGGGAQTEKIRNQINREFNKLTCFSLDKIRDLTVIRRGNRSTKKSKKGKVQTYVSVLKTAIFQLIQTYAGSFPFVPPPPSTLCSPQLQSTCHYIVHHYVKILHVHLGVANNMHPLSWGGTNGKDPLCVSTRLIKKFMLNPI